MVWPGRTVLPVGPAEVVLVSEPAGRPRNTSSHDFPDQPACPESPEGLALALVTTPLAAAIDDVTTIDTPINDNSATATARGKRQGPTTILVARMPAPDTGPKVSHSANSA
jgi:hypothetical protein